MEKYGINNKYIINILFTIKIIFIIIYRHITYIYICIIFQYGYSLSKNKNEILFYEIKFLIPKSNIFIYPNMCIANGPLEIIPNKDKKSTITYFLADMLMKLPTVCGKQLQISEYTPFIPVSYKLYILNDINNKKYIYYILFYIETFKYKFII